jgi:hypothetical protein
VPPSEFVMSIPHSAEKDDLCDPAKHAVLFSTGRPKSDAALCAEPSRLACGRLETSFGLDQDPDSKGPRSSGLYGLQIFRELSRLRWEGTHCLLASPEEDNQRTPKLAFVAFRGSDKDDPVDLAHDFNPWPGLWKQ